MRDISGWEMWIPTDRVLLPVFVMTMCTYEMGYRCVCVRIHMCVCAKYACGCVCVCVCVCVVCEHTLLPFHYDALQSVCTCISVLRVLFAHHPFTITNHNFKTGSGSL